MKKTLYYILIASFVASYATASDLCPIKECISIINQERQSAKECGSQFMTRLTADYDARISECKKAIELVDKYHSDCHCYTKISPEDTLSDAEKGGLKIEMQKQIEVRDEIFLQSSECSKDNLKPCDETIATLERMFLYNEPRARDILKAYCKNEVSAACVSYEKLATNKEKEEANMQADYQRRQIEDKSKKDSKKCKIFSMRQALCGIQSNLTETERALKYEKEISLRSKYENPGKLRALHSQKMNLESIYRKNAEDLKSLGGSNPSGSECSDYNNQTKKSIKEKESACGS